MAKYFGIRNSGTSKTVDQLCASDAEKSVCEAVDNHLGRNIVYLEVSDDDFNKVEKNTQNVEVNDGSLVWGTENDASQPIEKTTMQSEINWTIDNINSWLNSPDADACDEATINSWTAYKNEVAGLDIDAISYPVTGVCTALEAFVGNGLTEYKNLKRLP
jgi:hypothetical protein|tara:strand:+ start:51 stop:530 length:480 start_codon:yes stop_codon:yes gene_type:complete